MILIEGATDQLCRRTLVGQAETGSVESTLWTPDMRRQRMILSTVTSVGPGPIVISEVVLVSAPHLSALFCLSVCIRSGESHEIYFTNFHVAGLTPYDKGSDTHSPGNALSRSAVKKDDIKLRRFAHAQCVYTAVCHYICLHYQ